MMGILFAFFLVVYFNTLPLLVFLLCQGKAGIRFCRQHKGGGVSFGIYHLLGQKGTQGRKGCLCVLGFPWTWDIRGVFLRAMYVRDGGWGVVMEF